MENIAEYIFQQTGVNLSEKQKLALQTYCDFLITENEKYNLTAITEPAAVWEKHFADSILGSVLIPRNSSVCDVGSGAGFPALPLKIAREDVSVTLVDSLEKRVNFQKMLCEKLGLEATLFHARAEDFAQSHREYFDVVTARALAPLPVLLEYTAPLAKVGGIVLAYKTDESELSLSHNACALLGVVPGEIRTFTLPDGSRRALLTFEKISPTPPKYPRGQNKPRKQPL